MKEYFKARYIIKTVHALPAFHLKTGIIIPNLLHHGFPSCLCSIASSIYQNWIEGCYTQTEYSSKEEILINLFIQR